MHAFFAEFFRRRFSLIINVSYKFRTHFPAAAAFSRASSPESEAAAPLPPSPLFWKFDPSNRKKYLHFCPKRTIICLILCVKTAHTLWIYRVPFRTQRGVYRNDRKKSYHADGLLRVHDGKWIFWKRNGQPPGVFWYVLPSSSGRRCSICSWGIKLPERL